MKFFLVNHEWGDFRKTIEYIGFASEAERKPVSIGDRIVYFGQGLVAGVFEASSFVQGEFSGWREELPFQIKLKALHIPLPELIAKPLHYKVQLQKPVEGSPRLFELSEQEFSKIVRDIRDGKAELVF